MAHLKRIGGISLTIGVLLLSLPGWVGGARAEGPAPCDPAAACFDAGLNPATLIGDFYLDGNLVASGVNSARLTGAPGVAHQVGVRNIQEPGASGAGDVFVYVDQNQPNLWAGGGIVAPIRFWPQKNYVKGVLSYLCNPLGRNAADVVACRPTLDGAVMADVPAGATVTYPLAGGAHTLHTELVGDQAGHWSPVTRDDTVTIYAGRSYAQTTFVRAAFTLKGLLKISVWPKGLLADIYVDGALATQQAAGAELYVSAGLHQVEAKAVTDPAANGQYTYAEMAQSVWAYPASTRFLNLSPRKTWLVGFLRVSCWINQKGAGDDVACAVSENGAPLGVVPAGQQGTLSLTPGAHSLTLAPAGAQADKWNGPSTAAVTIWGGQTAYASARFNLRPAAAPLPASPAVAGGQPGVNHLGTEKVVLADYMMWFSPDTFDGTKTWDVPASGPYNSDDFGTIQRHIAQAQQACLNGFTAHWFGPSDSRTTNNFNSLLAASAGTNLRHAVVIQANILPGATEQSIIDAINFVLGNWAQNPNYLRLGGRPVIVFTDMPRPWGSDAAALAGWTRIRAATDPNHTSIWIAEGLHPTFNPLFDGLYVYRIDHRDYPQSWLKQSRWANELRAVERRGNLPIGGLYFADTIAAGFDDTRSVNAPADLRSAAPHFARDRRNGGYYGDTFAATANTGGDFLLVKSFNEWIEGTQIEPGASYGDLYLNLTCQYANAYRSR